MLHTRSPGRDAAALLLCALLAACGGSDIDDAGLSMDRTATGSASTLLDDDGLSMPSDARATPADRAARTRAGRYATPSQAEDLRRALGDDVSVVDVGCCGAESLEAAVGQALAKRETGAPASNAVLVRGSDLRLAAAVVDRLDALGLDRVWLVSP